MNFAAMMPYGTLPVTLGPEQRRGSISGFSIMGTALKDKLSKMRRPKKGQESDAHEGESSANRRGYTPPTSRALGLKDALLAHQSLDQRDGLRQ